MRTFDNVLPDTVEVLMGALGTFISFGRAECWLRQFLSPEDGRSGPPRHPTLVAPLLKRLDLDENSELRIRLLAAAKNWTSRSTDRDAFHSLVRGYFEYRPAKTDGELGILAEMNWHGHVKSALENRVPQVEQPFVDMLTMKDAPEDVVECVWSALEARLDEVRREYESFSDAFLARVIHVVDAKRLEQMLELGVPASDFAVRMAIETVGPTGKDCEERVRILLGRLAAGEPSEESMFLALKHAPALVDALLEAGAPFGRRALAQAARVKEPMTPEAREGHVSRLKDLMLWMSDTPCIECMLAAILSSPGNLGALEAMLEDRRRKKENADGLLPANVACYALLHADNERGPSCVFSDQHVRALFGKVAPSEDSVGEVVNLCPAYGISPALGALFDKDAPAKWTLLDQITNFNKRALAVSEVLKVLRRRLCSTKEWGMVARFVARFVKRYVPEHGDGSCEVIREAVSLIASKDDHEIDANEKKAISTLSPLAKAFFAAQLIELKMSFGENLKREVLSHRGPDSAAVAAALYPSTHDSGP